MYMNEESLCDEKIQGLLLHELKPVNSLTEEGCKLKMKITVETHVKATPDKVWGAYTNPEDIMQWNTASEDWHTTRSTVDLRVGGAFSSRMEAKDGSFGFDFAGSYTRIVPQELLEFSFGERMAVVEFLPSAQQQTVRVTFDAETENSIDQQRFGWQAILNNFARYVETKR